MTPESMLLVMAIILFVVTLLMQLLIIAPIILQIYLILKQVNLLLDKFERFSTAFYEKSEKVMDSVSSVKNVGNVVGKLMSLKQFFDKNKKNKE